MKPGRFDLFKNVYQNADKIFLFSGKSSSTYRFIYFHFKFENFWKVIIFLKLVLSVSIGESTDICRPEITGVEIKLNLNDEMIEFFVKNTNCSRYLFNEFGLVGNCVNIPNFDLTQSFQIKICQSVFLSDFANIYFKNIYFFDGKVDLNFFILKVFCLFIF